ncbi:hypothetical protein [Streptomyces sp. KMM 9044]|uniref:hypothetical protein n=1 Tax=Streptomyces sp. KMM 9044 TaxID=2744474 RepID=UPI00215140A2|nr:hypothetical protein [Streptomyces sp. KMM 9044]WAX79495.1 hypothetical protein HUV60_019305 [Streptomyces sp. KMM 9044]
MSTLQGAAKRSSTAMGPVVTTGTDAVPAPDRFGWWNDMVGRRETARSAEAPTDR